MSKDSPSTAKKAHDGARLEDVFWKGAKSLILTGDVEISIKRVVKVLTYSVVVEAHGTFMLIPKHSVIYVDLDSNKLPELIEAVTA
jgi:hypothetical protein